MDELLREIGLTENEIKVYLALNKLGISTIGPIVEKAQITNSKIYVILDKLISKGIVSHILVNGVKHFKTAQPERLMDFLEEKKKRIEKEEEMVRSIIPRLLSEQKEGRKDREVEVYEGFNGIKTIRERTLKLLKKGDELLILGASKFSTSQYEYYWENYHKRRIKAGIRCRYLMYEETKEKEGKKRENWKLTQVKYLQNPSKNPMRVDVYGDYTDIAIDAVTPFVISIKSKEISDSFRDHFNLLWNQAKSGR
jgi:sugar-specific transcriptional regulator TrmB